MSEFFGGLKFATDSETAANKETSYLRRARNIQKQTASLHTLSFAIIFVGISNFPSMGMLCNDLGVV
jgi:hypothetical protein